MSHIAPTESPLHAAMESDHHVLLRDTISTIIISARWEGPTNAGVLGPGAITIIAVPGTFIALSRTDVDSNQSGNTDFTRRWNADDGTCSYTAPASVAVPGLTVPVFYDGACPFVKWKIGTSTTSTNNPVEVDVSAGSLAAVYGRWYLLTDHTDAAFAGEHWFGPDVIGAFGAGDSKIQPPLGIGTYPDKCSITMGAGFTFGTGGFYVKLTGDQTTPLGLYDYTGGASGSPPATITVSRGAGF